MDPGYWFWCHKAVKPFQVLLDFILSLFIGFSTTSGWNSERLCSKLARKVQVVRILWRAAYLDSDYHDLNNYVYVHDAWLDPDKILDTFPSLTLHGINKTGVWFCDPGVEGVDVYDCERFPFAWHAQNNHARKFVLMSHQDMFDVKNMKKTIHL